MRPDSRLNSSRAVAPSVAPARGRRTGVRRACLPPSVLWPVNITPPNGKSGIGWLPARKSPALSGNPAAPTSRGIHDPIPAGHWLSGTWSTRDQRYSITCWPGVNVPGLQGPCHQDSLLLHPGRSLSGAGTGRHAARAIRTAIVIVIFDRAHVRLASTCHPHPHEDVVEPQPRQGDAAHFPCMLFELPCELLEAGVVAVDLPRSPAILCTLQRWPWPHC